jgi:polar amino acid transport system substrate-binding protein
VIAPARRTLAVVLLVVSLFALSACGSGKAEGPGGAELLGEDQLVVAMSGEFQPFSYREGNTLTGFDYDIAKAVAEEMGLELETKTGAFDTLIGGLKSNRYDVLVASMTPTEERKKQVDFTDGYYSSGATAFVAEDEQCTDVEDLDKPTLGVAAGTTYNDFLADKPWVGKVRTFSSDITALKDVDAGRLDAAVTDRLVGLYQIKEAGLGLKPCGDPLYDEEPAFAVKKGNDKLTAELNKAIAAVKKDGTYAEISERYFGQDISGS